MLTFLPPLLAILFLGWAGVPFYVLIPILGAWLYFRVQGRTWIAKADHHAGADGKWIAGGKHEWKEIWESWRSQPLPMVVILLSGAVIFWRGGAYPDFQKPLDTPMTAIHSGDFEAIGMKELVEALKSSESDEKLEKKLRLSEDKGLQMVDGGDGPSKWSLQNWSRRRPFREMN